MKVRSRGCCDCGGGACVLECRSVSGAAQLCGFSEFVDPSSPPKRYKKKTASGQITTCFFPAPGCDQPVCAGDNPSVFDYTSPAATTWPFFTGQLHVYGIEATFRPISFNPATAKWTYQLTRIGVIDAGPADYEAGGDAVQPHSQLMVGSAALERYDTIELGVCQDVQVVIRWYEGQWNYYTREARTLTTPAANVTLGGRRDTWAASWTYDLGTCEPGMISGTSQSVTFPTNSCSAVVEGTPAGSAIFGDGPEGAYGNAVTLAEASPTMRRWQGVGCDAEPTEGIYLRHDGEVVEELSDEDTAADAISRAAGAEPAWSTAAECQLAPAFATEPTNDGTIAYRKTQVRAKLGTVDYPLTVGHNYDLEIRFYRRAVASGGAWVYDSAYQLGFTATQTPSEWSAWIDVPNEAGWETAALLCSLKDVTP